MQTVILAAGEGQRLGPLTETRPKPMMPVANEPLLAYTLEAAVAAGASEVVLVVGHRRERIQNYFGDGDDWGVDLTYVVQDHQLGAAHALLSASEAVTGSFVVLNGDQCLPAAMVERLAAEWAETETPTLTVTRADHPVEYGAVDLEGDRVVAVSRTPVAETPLLVNVGAYAFDERVFEVIRGLDAAGEGDYGMATMLQRLADADELRAARYRESLLEVDYYWDLLSVNDHLLRARDRDPGDASGADGDYQEAADDHHEASDDHHEASDDWTGAPRGVRVHDTATVADAATLLPGTALGRNVDVGPGAVVGNAIAMEGARVGAGAVLRDCIVGADAVVGPNCTVEGGRTDVVVEGVVHDDVTIGGVVGDRATLGGNVTLRPGTVVGVDARVESGSVVDGDVRSGESVRRG